MNELILRLAMETAPSGTERAFGDILLQEVKDVADEVEIDVLGNTIAKKRGAGPHILLAAHADEPGVMVIDIDDKGFLRVIGIGDLAPSSLINRQVHFTNGVTGLICVEEGTKLSDITYDALFVDIGSVSETDALERAYIGLSGAVGSDVQFLNEHRLVGRALDNRVGCAAAILAFRALAEAGRQVTVAFTAQGVVGARGARTLAYQTHPDLALVIDAAPASDVPSGKRTTLSLGEGPAVKIMDGTAIVPLDVKNLLQTTAESHGIRIQHEVWPGGRSDAGAIQLSVDGVRLGGVSYPARQVGQTESIVDVRDVESLVQLVVEAAKAFQLPNQA